VSKENSFGKNERIKSKKTISALFDRNSPANCSFLVYPFKVIYHTSPPEDNLVIFPQVLISVSKRKFKNATDRNLVKRRTKEAYRKNKKAFDFNAFLAFIYVANDILDFSPIEKSMKTILARLEKETRDKASH
jgi:ribonuclease P protein component